MRLRKTLHMYKSPKKEAYVKFHTAVNTFSLPILEQSRSHKL